MPRHIAFLRPALVAALRDRHRGASTQRPLATTPAVHVQAFLPIHPENIARSPRANLEQTFEMRHRFPIRGERHHFFAVISLSIAPSELMPRVNS